MNTNERLIWRDGNFVPWQEATVHILSQSLQRGTLAFDFMSVHETAKGAAIFKLVEHIERLLETCRLGSLPLTYSSQELEESILETVRRNPGASSVKISVLLPSLEADLVPQDESVAVFIAAYDNKTDIIANLGGERHFSENLKLLIETEKRNRREDIMPAQAKVAANYASPMVAKWKARKAGYDDIILLDNEGYVAEAPTSNLFIVDSNGVLKTPPSSKVLHGITRAAVLELAAAEQVATSLEDLKPEDVLTAAEVFTTSTSIGIWPVISVDNSTIGNGSPGTTTMRLKTRFDRVTDGIDTEFDSWLTYVDPV
jgi:branched-chain amino acid aminotransferase